LKDAYRSVPLPLPWSYKDERDYKTIRELFEAPLLQNGSKHNALADCKFQVEVLYRIWKDLKKKETKIEKTDGTTKK